MLEFWTHIKLLLTPWILLLRRTCRLPTSPWFAWLVFSKLTISLLLLIFPLLFFFLICIVSYGSLLPLQLEVLKPGYVILCIHQFESYCTLYLHKLLNGNEKQQERLVSFMKDHTLVLTTNLLNQKINSQCCYSPCDMKTFYQEAIFPTNPSSSSF